MTRGFLPNTDLSLLGWSAHFGSLISAQPQVYSLSPEQAAAYMALHSAYASALAACDPSIRSKPATVAKNTARAELKLAARRTASIINGQATTISDAQKVELGLTVRAAPSVIARPESKPVISVDSVRAWTVTIRLRDSASPTRGVPRGALGGSVFTFVGEQPPSDLGGWKFERNIGRSKVILEFSNSNPPGTKVWIVASWFNGRKQNGPLSAAVSTNLQGGSVSGVA